MYDRINHNYRVVFFFFKEKKAVMSSKSFYSTRSLSEVCNYLIDQSDYEQKPDNSKVRTTVYDVENKKKRVIKLFIPECSSKTLRKMIDDNPEFIDLFKTRYTIVVENSYSSRVDKRRFTFNSELPINVLFNILKQDIDNMVKDNYDDSIIFDFGGNKQRKTHRIILYKSGSKKNHEQAKNSKSFVIDFPNFSSMEILDLLTLQKIEF